jgi:uncharacterized protein (UPF0332 family)
MNDREISNLIKRSRRYLRSAKLLIEDEDYASAISRAYYAVFYLGEALLLSKGLTYSSHQGVISGVGEHFIKTEIFEREFGKILNQAFQKRQTAEYDYDFFATEREAQEILDKAEMFFKEARKYLRPKRGAK